MYKSMVMVLLAMLLAGCGRETPDEAKQKLEEMKVAQTPAALIASTKTEKSEKVAELLVNAGVDPNARQANGMTALMSAVFNGQEDAVKALLEKGADLKLNAGGYNALSLAVERGNKSMVKMLLEAGAHPKARPKGGMSALEIARQKGRTDLVELLESYAKKNKEAK
jgi:ankyrin repeat protein